MSGLLVSVRSAAEAAAALAGGAALIDVKEPNRGPLGRADAQVLAEVACRVGDNCPVSAACGELLAEPVGTLPPKIVYAKWGLAGCGPRQDWQTALLQAARQLRQLAPRCSVVAVAYADWQRADAPRPDQVCAFAVQHGFAAFLLDTWSKDGTHLLDWVHPELIQQWVRQCRQAGVRVALAGSLSEQQIVQLKPLHPDWFAVRGAVCREGRREAAVVPDAVRRLATLAESV